MAAYVAFLLDQQRDARRTLHQQRVFRTRRRLETIPDHHLERYYRLPRPAVQRLCDALAPALRRPTARSCSLPVGVQVLLALRFYASGSFQSVVGDVANISQSSSSRIINGVSSALCDLANSGIKFSTTSRAALLTARGFLEINGFPKVLGCIDGTHIALKIAKKEQHLYRNRKGYDSLNVQAICNASNEITQLTVKWPGSTHDSFMWRNCDLADKFEAGNMPDGWLLGDAGYPLHPWLMTPFRKPRKKEEENYNECLTKTRQVIERTFGILKSRFRCLDRSGGVLQYTPSVCCRITVASAVLHNYCIRHHVSLAEPRESEDEEEEEDDRPTTARDTATGTAVRNELVNSVFK
ncbi:putative nuclease HARBI1 [Ixodes scapularis]|uniref:putative nuclease HARBI1 n=1 Tax=Ixodes scapularis TaxID=6945 RepID=UPI001A9D99EF|nr:putative nuclease HARBI1 [Ixodes scapularis]